jgi:hypothetical protein
MQKDEVRDREEIEQDLSEIPAVNLQLAGDKFSRPPHLL